MVNLLIFFTEGGISIPCKYTSYVSPVQTSKLFDEVRQIKEKDKTLLSNFETPYVVLQKNKYIIAKNQPLFTFQHPNYGKSRSQNDIKIIFLNNTEL